MIALLIYIKYQGMSDRFGCQIMTCTNSETYNLRQIWLKHKQVIEIITLTAFKYMYLSTTLSSF